jgi:hypothetical protein
VRGGQLHLKTGIETRFGDQQRDARLAEAQRVLLSAIVDEGQRENAAAWYYLGRTYAARQDRAQSRAGPLGRRPA